MEGVVAVFIPIVSVIVIGAIFALFFYYRHKTRAEIQTTVRAAIERGQELTPEVLERLSDSLSTKFGDLRRGVISIAIGIAFFVFAYFLGQEEAMGPLMGISAFPFLIGIAYIGLWYFTRRKD
jgi:di/tricarboxylate transporter